MPKDPNAPSPVFPALVLAVIVAIMLGGWWLFPRFQGWMARNDCVAAGHTDCQFN
jgi:hypothetical protein